MTSPRSEHPERRPGTIRAIALAVGCIAWLEAAALADPGLVVRPSEPVTLHGPDARLQILASDRPDGDGSGHPIDLTRAVRYETQPSGLLEVEEGGFVIPKGEGQGTVTVIAEGGKSVTVPVSVSGLADPPPVNFPNEVTPIFTKYGCNGGGCHGKVEGQNGFRLSLLGFEPIEDYEYLVKEGRGRRIFPAAPEFSLLLRKATGEMPHGGGSRIEVGSHPHRLLSRWISQGMPYGDPDDAVVESIAVEPRHRLVGNGAQQQLRVTASYSDGSIVDITRLAGYESNAAEMAECSENGLVTIGQQTGDVAVMVRFQEYVDVARFTVPLGAPVESLPPENNFIDTYVFAKLRTLGLPPSPVADDATFLRRVTVDVAGRLPTDDEVRAFLADPGSDKRARAVATLINSDGYADWFAAKWAGLFRNKRRAEENERAARLFHRWIRDALASNQPYDRMVTGLVAATGAPATNPPVTWYNNVRDTKEQLQDVAQMFLGIRMQCAQCHHHPYERWSQADYFGFEAFFTQVGRKASPNAAESTVFHRYGKAGARNTKTGETLPPKPLGAAPLDLRPDEDPRGALAEWMTDSTNPFFARMLVNRYWKHFFSRGLVEPEDDIRLTNPATHPELLDRLAAEFVASGYDLKALVATICNSQAYQLSAVPNAFNADDRQNYSRFYPRRLPAEILSDAIDRTTGTPTRFEDEPPGRTAVALPDDTATGSSYFLTVFGRPEMDSACECERTANANLAQTLHLLNAEPVQKKIAAQSGTAHTLAAADGRDTAAKVEELYLVALGRRPTPEESAVAAAYVGPPAGGEGAPDSGKTAFEDLVWALMNTKEFLFNH